MVAVQCMLEMINYKLVDKLSTFPDSSYLILWADTSFSIPKIGHGSLLTKLHLYPVSCIISLQNFHKLIISKGIPMFNYNAAKINIVKRSVYNWYQELKFSLCHNKCSGARGKT